MDSCLSDPYNQVRDFSDCLMIVIFRFEVILLNLYGFSGSFMILRCLWFYFSNSVLFT